MGPTKQRRFAHENRVFLYALLAGAPAIVVMCCLLYVGDYSPKVQWTIGVFSACFWLGYALAAREIVMRPLQTMANLLSA
ncbi:MAG: PAS domain-containing sensor histidine kinase, partial [Candidatus Didemnitutus sp.]|nr:PAS domain-containing sensor histidine kinase [Candidatus Didemnitutus sp.]